MLPAASEISDWGCSPSATSRNLYSIPDVTAREPGTRINATTDAIRTLPIAINNLLLAILHLDFQVAATLTAGCDPRTPAIVLPGSCPVTEETKVPSVARSWHVFIGLR